MTVSAKMTTDYSIDGALAHPAITHCDNCGFDWLDNGLNPVGCPYCKQPVGVEGFRTAVEEARRVWMDENPCEDGHDHVTPFDQFLYGTLAQRPAAVDGVMQAWISDNDLLKLGESIDEARNIRVSKKRTHLRVHPIYIPALAQRQGDNT